MTCQLITVFPEIQTFIIFSAEPAAKEVATLSMLLAVRCSYKVGRRYKGNVSKCKLDIIVDIQRLAKYHE